MFDYTSKDGTIRVYEGATAFYVVLLATGEERCMGDGTEYAAGYTTDDYEVSRDEQLRNIIEADTATMRNAYFPVRDCRVCGADTSDGEGYDGLCGTCADRKGN